MTLAPATLRRNQALLLKFFQMFATVYHLHWPQIGQQYFPLLLPLQDCVNPSEQMESPEHTYNTAYTKKQKLQSLLIKRIVEKRVVSEQK